MEASEDTNVSLITLHPRQGILLEYLGALGIRHPQGCSGCSLGYSSRIRKAVEHVRILTYLVA
jgi:hypothetical protein